MEFRYLRALFSLILMDTNLPENSVLINNIMKEALEASIFETYLESAPQFIFQMSIILRTGQIGKFI
jgi:hypothetical protein